MRRNSLKFWAVPFLVALLVGGGALVFGYQEPNRGVQEKDATAVKEPRKAPVKKSRSRWGAKYFPNVALVTHEGKSVRFFDDLLKDKVVIVVDDGIATGFTTLAAVKYIRSQKPAKIVLAVAVSAPEAAAKLEKEVDEMICLEKPADFQAVGQFYFSFPQVSDQEAKQLLL